MARRSKQRSILCEIRTSRPQETGWSKMQLGGVTLYGPCEKDLLDAVNIIESSIESILLEHLTLSRKVLQGAVNERLIDHGGVPKRLLGAILRRALRLGVMFEVPCLTENGKIKRVYMHSRNYPQYREKLAMLTDLLKRNYILDVRAAHSRCFPENGWASYYMAGDMLGHLAYLGRAVFEDSDMYTWPQDVEDAVCNSLK